MPVNSREKGKRGEREFAKLCREHGIEMATKPDCVHYDWGDTAPREYGAFCKVTCEALSESTCEGCELYEKKKLKENE